MNASVIPRVHDALPPNVVGPSSSASVDALNATVVPSGTAATPARIVNVSAHDAPGERGSRTTNSRGIASRPRAWRAPAPRT